MSAFIVGDDHLNVLVSYFVDYRSLHGLWCKISGEFTYLTEENASDFAYQLHRENVRSVNDRYIEDGSDELYQFKYLPQVNDLYSVAEIAGALDCLEYQSCERDDYHGSDAWLNLCNMRKHLLKKVAERELGEDTVWEIDEVKQSEKEYIRL